MAETFQDFDVEEFRLPPSPYGEIQTRQLPPRPGEGEPFIRGPIPFSWVAMASRLPGSCLNVAMAARFLRSRYQRKSSWSMAEIGWRAGLEERSARQALQALSTAGLISLARQPGRKPVLAILELQESATQEPPLWGPVPWPWWRAASQLPGKVPHVSLACWLLAGWRRSARFVLGPTWPELGLSQPSTYRGLESLSQAGLAEVIRARGRSPIVTILDSWKSRNSTPNPLSRQGSGGIRNDSEPAGICRLRDPG
jgi:DNA-binding transcriptional ArsR family regulator